MNYKNLKILIPLLVISLILSSNLFAQKSKALVVTYSMDGNTKIFAEKIIKRFNADSIFIVAKDYDDITGTASASGDAWDEVIDTHIVPEKVDMSDYNLIFLGSPIWWYRPAVPLWTFVSRNDFTGKKVILFNTFNSRFKQEYIDKFKNMIKKNGGELIDHIYVRRGRIIWQMDEEEMVGEFIKILDEKEKKYDKLISKEE